jgi:DNA-binding protein YbaB
MGGFNLQQLMSQAKQQYESLQKKMQETTVVKAGDIEMLQDLIMAAVNEAGRQIDQAMQSKVGGMLGGMGL